MNLEQYFKGYGRIISKIVYAFFLTIFIVQTAFGQDSQIAFTKKQIAFLGWGNGEDQIGEIVTKWGIVFPLMPLELDGKGNVYLRDEANQRILVLSQDGKVIRKIPTKRNTYVFQVDEDGNVLFDYQAHPGDKWTLVCVRADGSETEYESFRMGLLEHGVVHNSYDSSKTIAISKGEEKGLLPPSLIYFPPRQSDDTQVGWSDTLIVHTEKINNFLEKYGHRLDGDKVILKIEKQHQKREMLLEQGCLLGVDKNGIFYVITTSRQGTGKHFKVIDAYLDCYSADGNLIRRTVDESAIGGYQEFPKRFALDVSGNLFEAVESQDGVHIFKWSKN